VQARRLAPSAPPRPAAPAPATDPAEAAALPVWAGDGGPAAAECTPSSARVSKHRCTLARSAPVGPWT